MVFGIDTEETHVAVLHQVLQFLLVTFNGLALFDDGLIVLLVLQIEIALFRDVADREGDVEQLAFFVVDGVYLHFGVTVHAALNDDSLRTEMELFCLMVVENVTEIRPVEDGALIVIGVVLRLELQDLTHLLVGVQQVSLVIIEGQTYGSGL